MKRFFVFILASIGAATLIVVFLGLWTVRHFIKSEPTHIPPETFLTLSIGGESLPEHTNRSGILPALLKGKKSTNTLRDIVIGLDHAKTNPKIKGVLLVIEGNSLGFAQTQEIREAFKDFKQSGKPVYAFADSFGDLSNGTGSYYLATVADQIWIQPVGTVGLTGIFIETPFARKALDTFKILPRIDRREEYKGFMESLTESDYSPAVRANLQRIVDGLTTQIITDMSQARKFDVETGRRLINNGPYVSAEALKEKLIDQVGYLDDLKYKILITAEKQISATFTSFSKYTNHLAASEPEHKSKIALIFGEGTIVKSEKGGGFVDGSYVIDGRKFSKAIKDAEEDKDVKAIVIRLNSGGGSPTASETIWHHVKNAEAKGIPVIISMSDYAASGAYWISTAARKIVAQPGTLTGSIGVLGGKIVTAAAWETYGVHWGEVHAGENAAMWSTGQDYSEMGWKRLQAMMDDIYETFLIKVSESRHLDKEKVRSLAKGQVWTGIEAKENGLVDEQGGLLTAIHLAKQEAGITAETPVNLQDFPKPTSLSDLIMGSSDEGENEGGFFSTLNRLYVAFNRCIGLLIDLTTPDLLKAQTIQVKG